MGNGIQKPVILSVLSGGGFTFEMNALLRSQPLNARFIIFSTEWGGELPDGSHVEKSYLVPSFATWEKPSYWESIKAFIETFAKTIHVITRNKIDLVLTVGCSHSVPMLLAAKLLGKKSVFIESITRVSQLSLSGRIVYRLRLASLFLVQWPGLQREHPRSQLGTIL